MRSRTPSRHLATLAKGLLMALAIASGPAAVAQLRAENVEGWVLRPGALAHAAGPYSTRTGVAPTPRSFSETNFGATGWLGGSVQLEVPRDLATGHYARPKFVVGLPSDAMKSWMNSTGLSTERCLLPMLRARTRMSSDGDLDGTLWLYARCTFR